MNFATCCCLSLLFIIVVQCKQPPSCHPYQMDGLTQYPLLDPEGFLAAQPTDWDVSWELENDFVIANLNGKKLPYVRNHTIKGITTTMCFTHIRITLFSISKGNETVVHCNISCSETTPSIVDQSIKPIPSTVDQSSKPTPSTVDQSPKPTPSTVDQSPKPTPSTVDQSPKPTPSTVDQSPKPTPSTVDQSPKPTPSTVHQIHK
ncbi:myb-like protein V [Gouania willdenowi]|uniref:myb-like protein V n=1 Tax=Gouania willdenowi TaxID=441366 RepID=UPI0010565DB6|nr:myb-like protein V [Gouania willdenowi]